MKPYQNQPPFLFQLIAYSVATAVGLLMAYVLYLVFIVPVVTQAQPSGHVPVNPIQVVPNAIPTISIGPADGRVLDEQLTNSGNTAVPVETWAGDMPVSDTTHQAVRAYAADPDRAAACMHAAASGRRVSPACREIIEAMGSGR